MSDPRNDPPEGAEETPRDRLLHVLLREALGGETPPDVREAVLARARGERRPTRQHAAIARIPWLPWSIGAAAALLVAVVAAWALLRGPGQPPPPTSGGPVVVKPPGPEPLEQSRPDVGEQVLVTEANSVRQELGPGVNAEVGPHTRLVYQAGPAPWARLEYGEVTCAVEQNARGYEVRTGAGVVRVTGTRFTVRYETAGNPREQGERHMRQNWMVKVLVGTVVLSGAWGATEVKGAEGEGGTLTGIVLERDKDGKWIRVKPDGEQESRKFIPRWIGGMPDKGGGLDENMTRQLKEIFSLNRVKLTWIHEEHPRVIAIEALTPKTKEGVFTGRVTAKENHVIEVTNAAGVAERFMPRWNGGMPAQGGGLDKDMLRELEKVNVGDNVAVKWVFDERMRVVAIQAGEGGRR
jgi:hypothetical protein